MPAFRKRPGRVPRNSLLFVGEVFFDQVGLPLRVHVRVHLPQQVYGLLALAVHQEPAGSVGQADHEEKHDHRRYDGQGEDEAPAVRRSERRADEVGDGEARGGGYLESDEHRAAHPYGG
jgi:hypothetical protein